MGTFKNEADGPAFPMIEWKSPDGMYATKLSHGMSLRDWFAGQALAGILAFPGPVNGSRDKSGRSVVVAAYGYADAMLTERSKP